jgi:hypothetical protein
MAVRSSTPSSSGQPGKVRAPASRRPPRARLQRLLVGRQEQARITRRLHERREGAGLGSLAEDEEADLGQEAHAEEVAVASRVSLGRERQTAPARSTASVTARRAPAPRSARQHLPVGPRHERDLEPAAAGQLDVHEGRAAPVADHLRAARLQRRERVERDVVLDAARGERAGPAPASIAMTAPTGGRTDPRRR